MYTKQFPFNFRIIIFLFCKYFEFQHILSQEEVSVN